VASRELHVKGRIRRIEPKVFDVLAYLATHHTRVVGRSELLEAIWTSAAISDAVLATSIMKARRAIEDNDPDLPIIRTLHRTGYRLVADVETRSVEEDAYRSAPGNGDASRNRIAALPFQNLTGRAELLWTEYGLSALLSQALADGSNLPVVPTLEVLALTEGVGRNMSPRTCARLVSNTLDARYVISTQVRYVASQFELEFCVFHDGRILRMGSLRGPDVTELTLALGTKVCGDVLLTGARDGPGSNLGHLA
jgi:DNA-binding winged helix-turn-helix (wHTH) protein